MKILCSALMVLLAASLAAAQSQEPPPIRFPSPSAGDLQQEYQELAKRRGQLMEEEQLRQQIEDMKKEIQELEAKKALDESKKYLQAIISQYPNTTSAKMAKQAINALEDMEPSLPASTAPLPTVPEEADRPPILRRPQ